MLLDTIRCAVIGVGSMGKNHCRFIRECELGELAALCDLNQQVLKAAAHTFQVEKTYTDFHEVLMDPSIDAVNICLPHHLHAPVSIEAMKAKKHVLTEKPMALSLEEAEKMIKTAEKNNVKIGVSEEHRYSAQIQLAKKWIEEGRLGDLYLCSITERFGTWEPKSWGWRSRKEMIGGGSFIDQGHHAIDLARYLMGDPCECSAYMIRPTKSLEGEDVTLAIYRHSEDAVSQVHAGWAPGPPQFHLSIYGLKGTVLVEGIRGPGVVSLFGPPPKDVERSGAGRVQLRGQPIERVEDTSWTRPKYIAIEKFLEAVARNESFEYSGEEGKKNLAAIFAAYESARKGVSVRIRHD